MKRRLVELARIFVDGFVLAAGLALGLAFVTTAFAYWL